MNAFHEFGTSLFADYRGVADDLKWQPGPAEWLLRRFHETIDETATGLVHSLDSVHSVRHREEAVWRVARSVKNQAELTFRRAKIRREASIGDAPLVEAQDRRDFFVSHAGEDRAECARPLAEELQRRGRSVWFSGYELTVGDSLLQKINRGLANSQYGIVILSPHFFQKPWPTMELEGLAARTVIEGRKIILPVWHNITHAEIARYSPILADRLGVRTSNGIAAVVDELLRAFEAEEGAES
jgi:hypothetical protein